MDVIEANESPLSSVSGIAEYESRAALHMQGTDKKAGHLPSVAPQTLIYLCEEE